jgi:NADH-quinone oxidoreductase subunit J
MTVFLYLFAILALVGAIGTVTSRHPISAAMSLVASFLSVASLYALLDAHLIAAVQVIVYVGAIMVLIIYTILLMDLRDEDVRERLGWLGAAGVVTGALWLGVVWLRLGAAPILEPVTTLPEGFGTVRGVAMELFTKHAYTFEVVSLLLLAAIVGALTLAMRQGNEEGDRA